MMQDDCSVVRLEMIAYQAYFLFSIQVLPLFIFGRRNWSLKVERCFDISLWNGFQPRIALRCSR
jgi:hypothetical protein